MTTFEIGKKYKTNGGEALEVTGRANGFITYAIYQHTGRSNQRITKQGRARVKEWGGDQEAVIIGSRTIESAWKWHE